MLDVSPRFNEWRASAKCDFLKLFATTMCLSPYPTSMPYKLRVTPPQSPSYRRHSLSRRDKPLAIPPLPSQSFLSPTSPTSAAWNIFQWFPGRRPGPSFLVPKRIARAGQSVVTLLSSPPPDVSRVVRGSLAIFEYAFLAIQTLMGSLLMQCLFEFSGTGRSAGSATNRDRQPVTAPISAWAEGWGPGGARIMPPRAFAFASYQLSPGKSSSFTHYI